MVAFAQFGAIERMVKNASGQMSRDAAQAVLQWQFAEPDKNKLSELSEKARSGKLSPEEGSELDWYLMLGDFLSIVQSRARVTLASPDPSR